jgi:hypothetical protein
MGAVAVSVHWIQRTGLCSIVPVPLVLIKALRAVTTIVGLKRWV